MLSFSTIAEQEKTACATLIKDEVYDRALPLCIASANAGHLEDTYLLSRMYSLGQGVDIDQVQAFKWVEMAAKKGHPESHLKLSRFYLLGIGVKENSIMAAYWSGIYVERNYPRAMHNLGEEQFKKGNKQEAIKAFSEAADLEYLDSVYALAKIYLETGKDNDQALRLLKSAGAKNHTRSLEMLSEIYSDGKIVKKDIEIAKDYIVKAMSSL